jgi:hypothetical protein
MSKNNKYLTIEFKLIIPNHQYLVNAFPYQTFELVTNRKKAKKPRVYSISSVDVKFDKGCIDGDDEGDITEKVRIRKTPRRVT